MLNQFVPYTFRSFVDVGKDHRGGALQSLLVSVGRTGGLYTWIVVILSHRIPPGGRGNGVPKTQNHNLANRSGIGSRG